MSALTSFGSMAMPSGHDPARHGESRAAIAAREGQETSPLTFIDEGVPKMSDEIDATMEVELPI